MLRNVRFNFQAATRRGGARFQTNYRPPNEGRYQQSFRNGAYFVHADSRDDSNVSRKTCVDRDVIHAVDAGITSDIRDNSASNDDSTCMFDDRCSGVRDGMGVIFPVIFPVFLKDENLGEGSEIPIQALRDTGNFSMLIINEELIHANCIMHERTVKCKGIFQDGKMRNYPTTIIKISSPHFGYEGYVTVPAIVTKLPEGLDLIIGNSFYVDFPFLTDIVSVRHPVNVPQTESHVSSNVADDRKDHRMHFD